jgi:hypothetical protein
MSRRIRLVRIYGCAIRIRIKWKGRILIRIRIRVRGRIRIRIKVKGRIRIRIKVMWIRNTVGSLFQVSLSAREPDMNLNSIFAKLTETQFRRCVLYM